MPNWMFCVWSLSQPDGLPTHGSGRIERVVGAHTYALNCILTLILNYGP
jgi:hypothetical protein